MANSTKSIDVEKIDTSIQMLKMYVNEPSIDPVLAILEALKKDPGSAMLLDELSDTLTGLGIVQGAVLNYAPYIAILISYDLFGND